MLLASAPAVPLAYPLVMFSTRMPGFPTETQPNPSQILGGGHTLMLWLLPTNVTDCPLAKHQRVAVAGSSFSMVVPFCVTLKTRFGLSQHHHHHGKRSRICGFANLAAMSAVRAASGLRAALARAKPWPVIRSDAAGRLNGATLAAGEAMPCAGRNGNWRSTFSITARISSSHHHGQQCHQMGQQGQQHRHSHQLKVAVNWPSALVSTVSMGVSVSPVAPDVTL